MSKSFIAAVAALVAAFAWSAPAEAEQGFGGRPPERNIYAGLLAADFTPVDASANFNPASLNGAKLAILASANFNEYSRRWNHWYGEGNIENYWAHRLNNHNRDDTRIFEQTTDPRAFADQLVTVMEPHVGEVFAATDFQQAREQGATYYLVVDAWFGTPNFLNQSFKAWAGAYLLDGSLQLVFQSSADHQVNRGLSLVGSVLEADARTSRRAYEGATQPVVEALRARLGEPPAPAAPAPAQEQQ